MATRAIAPRMRLLGLLLICASIMMGLLLSAIGVTAVNLSSPFAQKVVQRIDHASGIASNSLLDSPPNSIDSGSNISGTFGKSQVELNGSRFYDWQQPQTGPFNPASYERPLALEQTAAPQFTAEEVNKDGGLQIPLWYLITPICALGVFLWMTPMPAPASARKTRRR